MEMGLKEEKILLSEVFFSDDDTFALRVKDDGMTGAGIFPNDVVMVRRQNIAQMDEIIVALVGSDKATLRWLRKRDDLYFLDAANEKHKSIQVDEDVSVIGKVIRVVRDFK